MTEPEPSNWDLHRGIQRVEATLSRVMTVDLFRAYQEGAERRLSDIEREAAASVIRHNRDVERLQHQLEEHAKQSAADKKAAADRASNQRAAIAVCFLAAVLPTAIAFLRIGGT